MSVSSILRHGRQAKVLYLRKINAICSLSLKGTESSALLNDASHLGSFVFDLDHEMVIKIDKRVVLKHNRDTARDGTLIVTR